MINEKNKRGLAEEISVSDAGKYGGFVILRDNKTGKYIFRKHNMIVNEGKKVLAAYLFGHFSGNNAFTDSSTEKLVTNSENYSGYQLKYLFLSNDATETTFDMTYSDLISTTTLTGSLSSTVASSYNGYVFNLPSDDVPVEFVQDENTNKYAIKLELEFTDSLSLTSVSSLGLLMGDGSGTVLFSRINFDTIPVVDDTSYTLLYYVYL